MSSEGSISNNNNDDDGNALVEAQPDSQSPPSTLPPFLRKALLKGHLLGVVEGLQASVAVLRSCGMRVTDALGAVRAWVSDAEADEAPDITNAIVRAAVRLCNGQVGPDGLLTEGQAAVASGATASQLVHLATNLKRLTDPLLDAPHQGQDVPWPSSASAPWDPVGVWLLRRGLALLTAVHPLTLDERGRIVTGVASPAGASGSSSSAAVPAPGAIVSHPTAVLAALRTARKEAAVKPCRLTAGGSTPGSRQHTPHRRLRQSCGADLLNAPAALLAALAFGSEGVRAVVKGLLSSSPADDASKRALVAHVSAAAVKGTVGDEPLVVGHAVAPTGRFDEAAAGGGDGDGDGDGDEDGDHARAAGVAVKWRRTAVNPMPGRNPSALCTWLDDCCSCDDDDEGGISKRMWRSGIMVAERGMALHSPAPASDAQVRPQETDDDGSSAASEKAGAPTTSESRGDDGDNDELEASCCPVRWSVLLKELPLLSALCTGMTIVLGGWVFLLFGEDSDDDNNDDAAESAASTGRVVPTGSRGFIRFSKPWSPIRRGAATTDPTRLPLCFYPAAVLQPGAGIAEAIVLRSLQQDRHSCHEGPSEAAALVAELICACSHSPTGSSAVVQESSAAAASASAASSASVVELKTAQRRIAAFCSDTSTPAAAQDPPAATDSVPSAPEEESSDAAEPADDAYAPPMRRRRRLRPHPSSNGVRWRVLFLAMIVCAVVIGVCLRHAENLFVAPTSHSISSTPEQHSSTATPSAPAQVQQTSQESVTVDSQLLEQAERPNHEQLATRACRGDLLKHRQLLVKHSKQENSTHSALLSCQGALSDHRAAEATAASELQKVRADAHKAREIARAASSSWMSRRARSEAAGQLRSLARKAKLALKLAKTQRKLAHSIDSARRTIHRSEQVRAEASPWATDAAGDLPDTLEACRSQLEDVKAAAEDRRRNQRRLERKQVRCEAAASGDDLYSVRDQLRHELEALVRLTSEEEASLQRHNSHGRRWRRRRTWSPWASKRKGKAGRLVKAIGKFVDDMMGEPADGGISGDDDELA